MRREINICRTRKLADGGNEMREKKIRWKGREIAWKNEGKS